MNSSSWNNKRTKILTFPMELEWTNIPSAAAFSRISFMELSSPDSLFWLLAQLLSSFGKYKWRSMLSANWTSAGFTLSMNFLGNFPLLVINCKDPICRPYVLVNTSQFCWIWIIQCQFFILSYNCCSYDIIVYYNENSPGNFLWERKNSSTAPHHHH